MLDQRGTRAKNAMTQDEGDRRLTGWYGFLLICLSVFAALFSTSHGYGRDLIILAGASLVIGVGMLAFSFRRHGRD
jgi:hypothetical protein